VLGDPISAKKLTHMLIRCMEEREIDVAISSPLPKQYVHHVSRRKHMRRDFKMKIKIESYKMDDVMLELGSNMKILLKKSWDLMGKTNLVWSPIHSSFPINT
jgi:hypothetical protein